MFTAEQFVAETRRIINASPDYVYPEQNDSVCPCSYLECNTACVFGRVLANLGISQAHLEKCENTNIQAVLNHDVYGIRLGNRLVLAWALEIQSKQDIAMPWGDCLKYANTVWPSILKEFPE